MLYSGHQHYIKCLKKPFYFFLRTKETNAYLKDSQMFPRLVVLKVGVPESAALAEPRALERQMLRAPSGAWISRAGAWRALFFQDLWESAPGSSSRITILPCSKFWKLRTGPICKQRLLCDSTLCWHPRHLPFTSQHQKRIHKNTIKKIFLKKGILIFSPSYTKF